MYNDINPEIPRISDLEPGTEYFNETMERIRVLYLAFCNSRRYSIEILGYLQPTQAEWENLLAPLVQKGMIQLEPGLDRFLLQLIQEEPEDEHERTVRIIEEEKWINSWNGGAGNIAQ